MKKNKSNPKNEKVLEYIRESNKEIVEKSEEVNIEIPQQTEFFKTPVRFGNIPVDKLPMGCDEKEQYRKIYPRISLPFQAIEKISFGNKDMQPNRLIFGDNLHIMRALPSNSIDLIYIDPPFFSGKNYNVVFGDQNEVRSFTDIWEGGMPGYLTWLNARILEMKRLLKPDGSIFVHCDWHASHYIKCELDKIFGYDYFRNEIIWRYRRWTATSKTFQKMHDVLLFYTKTSSYLFNKIHIEATEGQKAKHQKGWDSNSVMIEGRRQPQLIIYDKNRVQQAIKEGRIKLSEYARVVEVETDQTIAPDVWEINYINSQAKERIGYPTQKPEALLERIIKASSNKGDVIADFFCGGGTTPAVAQKLGRRWIACDVSKIAISVTRDRILRILLSNTDKKEVQQTLGKVPDISIEHWGVYEVPELVKMNEDTFRNFIITAYNARLSTSKGLIHGYKQSTAIFVGSHSQDEPVTEKEVIAFAKEVIKKLGQHQGIMIAWAFTPEAQHVAQQLDSQHAIAIDFVKIQLIPIESEGFREHVTSKHPEYRSLLKFILPPQVRISYNRINSLEYEFDVSESVSLNPSGKIINVQWDFDYHGNRFISTQGYSFLGMINKKPVLKIKYKFNSKGKRKVACKVQDDEGGEKLEIIEVDVK